LRMSTWSNFGIVIVSDDQINGSNHKSEEEQKEKQAAAAAAAKSVVVMFVGEDSDHKMASVLLLVLLACVQWVGALDELLEPTVLIGVLVRNKAHVLPYFLGTLDALDYPKRRIQLFIRLDHSEDDSAEMLNRWLGRVNGSYHSVEFSHDDDPVGYAGERSWFDWTEDRYREVIRWKQYALDKGRRAWADYLLLLDSDVLFTDRNTLRLLIAESKTIVAPMLTSIGAYSNFWASTTDRGYYKRTDDYDRLLTRQLIGCFAVPMVNSAVLIDLRWQASDKLALEPDRLLEPYHGPVDDMLLLAASVRQAGLRMHVSNRHQYGVLLPPLDVDSSLSDDLDNLQFLLLESLHHGPPGLTTTPLLLEETKQPVPVDKMHFDELYLINLLRRPDRRLRMLACFAVLGLQVRLVEAVDGRLLEPDDLNAIGVKQMPDYRDPYHKRPMTLGEVGCFLSHYNVWRDMLDRGYQRVVIFEDDLRFTRAFRRQVGAVMAELDANVPDWDLVYLGRKRLNPDQDGPLVENCSFVSHVGYSYWTLAYALSRRICCCFELNLNNCCVCFFISSGAEKLVKAEPLKQLVPVDEYLPMMFNRHPEKRWMSRFERRDLKAYTAEPLLVYPVHYLGEEGYISDTENTGIVEQQQQTLLHTPAMAHSTAQHAGEL
ncbi:Procollagen galactosyltransferase 1, partial [Trichinella zimbabwensis]